MEVCGLSKARPIVCNDSPAFQRRHTSVRCAAESSTYFPCVIDNTPGRKIYIRWCCVDLLNAPLLRVPKRGLGSHPCRVVSSSYQKTVYCHGRGREFESRRPRHIFKHEVLALDFSRQAWTPKKAHAVNPNPYRMA